MGDGARAKPRQAGGVMAHNTIVRSAQARPATTKCAWHAVSVFGMSACRAAAELRGKRALPMDAPRLPLPNCAWPWKCACVYRHHADRRAGPRRASDRGMYGGRVVEEKRKSGGRRFEDSADR